MSVVRGGLEAIPQPRAARASETKAKRFAGDLERERQARVLEAAALELEVNGWSQGAMLRDNGTMCMVGAIAKTLGFNLAKPTIADGARYRAAKRILADDDPHSATPIVFNDTPGRTAEQVLFVLRWRAQEIRDGR